MEKTAKHLKIGEKGVIKQLKKTPLTNKIMEMGVLPGQEIRLKFKAPLGDPACYDISGYNLSLRYNEADHILLEP